MSTYPKQVLDRVQAVCSTVESQGWSVDLALDFGSHARGEARPDSDYDMSLYVHRDGWLYLFEEYAKGIQDPGDERRVWHQKVRKHFRGYQELTSVLERAGREAASRYSTAPRAHVINVFDTRLILYNLPHETWPLFELAGGAPLAGTGVGEGILGFLRSTRPFHHRTVEVHITQCECAKQQAAEGFNAACTPGTEGRDARRSWLSHVVTYLRNSAALLSLLTDGWFVTQRKDVLNFVRCHFPGGYQVMQHMYRAKCDPSAHNVFLSSGFTEGELGRLAVPELHRRCAALSAEVHRAIAHTAASQPALHVSESEWLPTNLDRFDDLPIYRALVGPRTA